MAPAPDDGLGVPVAQVYSYDQTAVELVVVDPDDANVFLADNKDLLLAVAALAAFRLGLVGVDWVVNKMGWRKKDEFTKNLERLTTSKAKEFNVPDAKDRMKKNKLVRQTPPCAQPCPGASPKAMCSAALQDTGVRFSDVAGIDFIKNEVIDVLSMMKGDPKWNEMGAKMPRGILLAGPPGTGKTLLAKAMAGEAGIPFYSANGAEFVEMFQGVAAARVRSLFAQARKHKDTGAIIFIDEIDAIGLARRSGGGDAGSAEREQGLLQLLVEMDGFRGGERILVMGATNRVDVLDRALIRPGYVPLRRGSQVEVGLDATCPFSFPPHRRFDRVVYMGNPTKKNRLAVLQVHARGKQFAEPDAASELLSRIAEVTEGYSGAELANLLNEAAILSVREGKRGIDMPVILEAMDKVKLGLPGRPLPENEGKRRFALVQAAKAVAVALTPAMPQIERVMIRPRSGKMARILTRPVEREHYFQYLAMEGTNAVPRPQERPTEFEVMRGAMLPLYAPRAFEEVAFGPKGVTLGTAKDLSRAADVALFLVARSGLHPAFRDLPPVDPGVLGAKRGDGPTGQELVGANERYETHVAALIDEAYLEAKRVMAQHRPAIEKAAEALLRSPNESITGDELLAILRDTPPAPLPEGLAAEIEARAAESDGAGSRVEPAGEQGDTVARAEQGAAALASAAQVALGEASVEVLLSESGFPDRARLALMREKWGMDGEAVERLKAARAYATQEGAPFPPPPAKVPECKGVTLEQWLESAEPAGTEIVR